MLLGVSGQYLTNIQGSAANGYYGGSSWKVEGHAGLRYVFNPGKAFEFSSYVMAGAFHGRFDQFYQRGASTGAEGTFGLSIDRGLIPGVGARISSSLVSSGWAHVTNEQLNSLTKQHSAGFYAAVGFQPLVEVRMTF
jgi:hypothetical protein